MSVFESLVDQTDLYSPENGSQFSFSQKLNEFLKVPLFGLGALKIHSNTVTTVCNITLSKNLLKQLVIVDDGLLTYNAYKNNTIRVS